RAHRGHLAAREALIAVALEPEVGIVVAVDRPHPREGDLEAEGDQTPPGRGIHRPPQGATETRLAAFPERAHNLATDQPVHQRVLDLAIPDPAVVVAPLVIDAERAAARATDGHAGEKQHD